MSTPESFADLFAPEPEKADPNGRPAWKVLLVDDEQDIHAVLRLALQGVAVDGRRLELLDAFSGDEARALLSETHDIAIILLDVVMETERAGLDLVRHIREELDNHAVQIVIVTGQPGYAPPREVVVDYEINDYRLKSELTAEKIFVFVQTALRNYDGRLCLEERNAETAALANTLRETARELDHYFNSAIDLFCIADTDGNFTKLNPAWEEALGYPVADLMRQPFLEFVHPDDREATLASMGGLEKQQPVLNFVNRFRHKNGDYRWIEWRARPEGRTIYAAARDITERQRAEAALRENEATFQKLFENSPDGILLINERGLFVECNQAALDLLKMNREQFILLPPVKISPEVQPDGRRSDDAAVAMIEQAYRDGRNRFDWTCVDAEGGEFIVEVSLTPIQLKGQSFLHAQWRDVTDRKRIELELARHKEVLEVRVAERTADLEARSKELADTQFAMDKVGIGICWNDATSGRFIYANDEACRQLGLLVAHKYRWTFLRAAFIVASWKFKTRSSAHCPSRVRSRLSVGC